MAVRTHPEHDGSEQFGRIYPLISATSDALTPNDDRNPQLRRVLSAASNVAVNALDATGSLYQGYIRLYHQVIPYEPARNVLNYTSPVLLGLAISVGVVALGQANGLDQPKPKVERVTTPAKGPTSIDDCEAFSAGDDMFHACMERRERFKQTMTP